MIRQFALWATSAMAFASAAIAEDAQTFMLDNGMEVVVIEDHRAPVVVHMVWYKVGAADEPQGASGIAHFLEHLMFKGTEIRGPGEFSDIVAANGGTDNAFTSQDYTAYFQRVAADRLGLMMEMEADRMVNLVITEEQVDIERDVVIEERNQRTENEPGALFGEQRSAAQYLNHPYGDPIIGWMHEIEELSLEDAIAVYKEFYAPNNAILIVAGDVEAEEVLEQAQATYGQIPANPDLRPRERSSEPPQLAERRLIYEDGRVAQPYVIRSYLAPERDPGAQEEAAALTMLAELLGGNALTSVLGQKLQFETQASVYTSAFYRGASLDDTTFGLVMVPVAGMSLEDAEAALDKAVAEFIEEGVDSEQFARIKADLRASLIYGLDSVQGRAREYGVALTSGLTVADVEAWPDVIDAVTEDDVIAAAKSVFDRTNAVTGWIRAPQNQEVSQ